MDMTAAWTAIAGIILAGTGILVRQFFVWFSSKNIFKNAKLKDKLLEIIEKMSIKGIAVANQEFVDRLRFTGQWKNYDENTYRANSEKALTIAKDSVIELLTRNEKKRLTKLFGEDKVEGVVKSVILEQLRKQKDNSLLLQKQ
jgi:hypothetical protein